MAGKDTSGLVRLFRAAIYSLQGLKAAFKNEQAFRLEVFLAVFLIPTGGWLGKTGVESALLIACILLVLIVELINSGIEAVVDRFGGERHELSGLAKDIGSAAVLVALVNVLIVWILVLFY